MAGNHRPKRVAADLAGFKGLGAAVHLLRQEKGLTPGPGGAELRRDRSRAARLAE